jgi:hypothetical protein
MHKKGSVVAPELPQASCQQNCAACNVWEKCKVFKVLMQVNNTQSGRKGTLPPPPSSSSQSASVCFGKTFMTK